MGLRLRSQMAFFLFMLFGSTILLITYFNVSLLARTLERQAEQEALAAAVQVANWLRETLQAQGPGTEALGGLVDRHLGEVARFRGCHVLSRAGAEIYSFQTADQAVALLASAPARVAASGQPLWTLWSFEPEGPPGGRPFKGLGPFSRGTVSLEYFLPLRSVDPGGPVQAILHLSLGTAPLVSRLQLIVAGNAVLAILFLITGFIAVNLWGEHAVNRPMNVLLQAQERLGRGDYTVKVDLDIPSVNEMIVLTNSFNRMARELQGYQEALEDKTRSLEEVNQQYRQLNEGLEQQVEEKTGQLREFFSMLTHDLRIPLAAIQGYAELLGRGELTPRQARALRGIQGANAHLLELVRNLLDTVRFEAGPVEILVEPFELADLLGEVVSNLGPPAGGSRVRVDLDLVDGRVYADRTRIGRVLTNLVGNALSVSPVEEPIVIRAVERTGQVEVSVRDRGPGIPAEHLPQLFQKFRHFPGQQGPSPGLGLGLYIVRRILEAHGRSVSVESTVGEGTRFWFELPLPPVARLEGGTEHGA